jgi:hypothetical protein
VALMALLSETRKNVELVSHEEQVTAVWRNH